MTASIGFFTIDVPDSARARTFYAGVFGWDLQPFKDTDGFHADELRPPGGIEGGSSTPGFSIYFKVSDINDAVARVRERGGTASDPVLYRSGWNSRCTDDQGIAFQLWEPAEGYA